MRKASAVRTRKLLGTLKMILADAQLRGLTAQTPAAPVKVETRTREKRRLEVGRDIPTREEAGRLIDKAEGRWRPFYVTAILTGMRASELRGLRWSDVDFAKKQVHVRQRVDRWNNVGLPKSRAGQRSIPLAPFVLNTLREWKLASPGGELVFPSGNGTPLMHSNICNGSFYPLQVKAGVIDETGEAKYNFHALRHLAASHWIDLGFAPKKIQSWMGHASIVMTLDVYSHLFDNLDDDHEKLAAGELSIVG
jgi:integrase